MLLKRKNTSTPPPVQPEPLAAKLASEVRSCATCGYTVTNPMTDRCPRCFSAIALSEHTNCGDCSHQGSCEFQKLAAMQQRK